MGLEHSHSLQGTVHVLVRFAFVVDLSPTC